MSQVPAADVGDGLLDALIGAGLRHEVSWTQVAAMLHQLPVEGGCPHCGGDLEAWALPGDRAWRCATCGRLWLEGTRDFEGHDDVLLGELRRLREVQRRGLRDEKGNEWLAS